MLFALCLFSAKERGIKAFYPVYRAVKMKIVNRKRRKVFTVKPETQANT